MTTPPRMTAAEFLAQIKDRPKRREGKKREGRVRGVKKATFGREQFDSTWERDRYVLLLERQRRGLIANLKRQVRIPLKGAGDRPILGENGRPRVYVADFVYDDVPAGCRIVEDAKGWRDPLFVLKKAILRTQGITVTEVRRDGK